MTRFQFRNCFALVPFGLCAAGLAVYRIRDSKRPKITFVRVTFGENPDDRTETTHPTRHAAHLM